MDLIRGTPDSHGRKAVRYIFYQNHYRKSDGATRKMILGCIFAEKLVVEKGKVEAPVFTEPIQLILRISEVLRRSEKKKEVDLNQSLVATLTKNPIFKI